MMNTHPRYREMVYAARPVQCEFWQDFDRWLPSCVWDIGGNYPVCVEKGANKWASNILPEIVYWIPRLGQLVDLCLGPFGHRALWRDGCQPVSRDYASSLWDMGEEQVSREEIFLVHYMWVKDGLIWMEHEKKWGKYR